MKQVNYNPDVLSCIANLSNDEVFTPPALVNDILGLLPALIWQNKDAKFLDPVSKSGVFLREITKRLMKGLEKEIPDPQKRVNHICTRQVFGVAITELTSLLSRRTLYCSKYANSKYSICNVFEHEQGNIAFDVLQHTWENGRCIFCGATQEVYERDKSLETYAYPFIHTDITKRYFLDMKFDVIVGNPPYQLSDGGHGASAKPIYQKFVQQAIKLNPRYLTMITPSRWFVGGRVGDLSDFREEMLNDDRIRIMHDYINAGDCFPGVELKGGVNYFLWDRDNKGKCKIFTHENNTVTESERSLLENGSTTFIRRNEAIPILKKVFKFKEDTFGTIVSANDPFGFDVREENSMKRVKPNYKLTAAKDSVAFYYNGWKKAGLGYIDKKYIKKNADWLDKFKIFVPKAIGIGDSKSDIVKPVFPDKNSCCSETYIVIGPFRSKQVMLNASSYISTRFFHFLLSLKKITQEARRNVYAFIPMQDFSEGWSDEKLYSKYKLSSKEIAFIESVTPEIKNDSNG